MFALLPSPVVGPGPSYPPNPLTTKHVLSSSRWDPHHHEATTDIRRRVTIYRNSLDTPWGFRLQGGKDFNTPLSVKRVFSGSPADGQLTRDDLILAINDQSVDDLPQADVLEKVKSAGSSIVLTVQTSALESEFGYASQGNFQVKGTSHQEQLYSPEETTRQYDSYQTPSASSYDTLPTTYETSPTTYETSPTTYETSYPSHSRATTNIYSPKITTHESRHRSAKRFQATAAVPSGLSEPGWVPRPKSVSKAFPSSSPQLPHPPPQYRSPPAPTGSQPAQYPAHRDIWKAESASVAESGVSAWYGSLRSTRAPHSWELRAAKIQIPPEQESYGMRKAPEQEKPQLHQAQVQQPQQVQPEPSRTFKAEIRGLILARPSYTQSGSTPEWEDASEANLYRSRDHAHSAPETAVADTTLTSEVKNMTFYQDNQTSPAAIRSQQTVESPPFKIQPSLLFGDRSGRVVQQPTAQSHVIIRAEPQATKTTIGRVQTRHEVTLTAPARNAQIVSAPTIVPVQEAVSAFQANPQIVPDAQAVPTTQVKAPVAIATPSVQNLVKPSKEHPPVTKVPAQPAKPTYLPERVERFNPTPDMPESKAPAAVKHLHPVPERRINLPHMPVERFNPVPDRPEELTQTHVKHSSVPQTLGKSSQIPVQCFHPVPDRAAKIPKTPVERFNPVPDRPNQLTQAQEKHLSPTSGKFPKMSVERFNPVPDMPEKIQKMPVERFNPMPDRLNTAWQ